MSIVLLNNTIPQFTLLIIRTGSQYTLIKFVYLKNILSRCDAKHVGMVFFGGFRLKPSASVNPGRGIMLCSVVEIAAFDKSFGFPATFDHLVILQLFLRVLI
jgi:hypothetical protein